MRRTFLLLPNTTNIHVDIIILWFCICEWLKACVKQSYFKNLNIKQIGYKICQFSLVSFWRGLNCFRQFWLILLRLKGLDLHQVGFKWVYTRIQDRKNKLQNWVTLLVECKYRTRAIYTRVQVRRMKKWSGTGVPSLYCQILLVLTQVSTTLASFSFSFEHKKHVLFLDFYSGCVGSPRFVVFWILFAIEFWFCVKKNTKKTLGHFVDFLHQVERIFNSHQSNCQPLHSFLVTSPLSSSSLGSP